MFSSIFPPKMLWFIYLRKEEMKWLLKLLEVSYANELGSLDHFGNILGKYKKAFSHLVALFFGQSRKLQKEISKLQTEQGDT